ncbi:MAG TPA: hypothetical protein VMU95_01420, partial [Trebonia sp.]|nr:hypothetical protein [Trebonia sp.]
WRTRLVHVLAAGLVTALVSLSWMTAVSLVPAHDRPYVDGTTNDSVYSQVFDYNGLVRLGGHPLSSAAGPPAPFLITTIEDRQTLNFVSLSVRPSWHRLLSGPFGLDGGWLLPAAAVSVAIGLRRRRDDDEQRPPGRRDPIQAAIVLWGGWWVVLAVFFSSGTYLNSYYIAALAPALAALCGVGVSLCGPPPWTLRVRLIMLGTCAACLLYGLYLLTGASFVPGWVKVTAEALFLVAALLLLLAPRLQARLGRRGSLLIPVVACAALIALPAAASADSVARGLGPFDTPFESPQISAATTSLAKTWPTLTRFMQQMEARQGSAQAVFGTDTSGLAAPYILASGREVLPIGGYLGGVPAPTLAEVRADVRDDDVHLFLLPIRPVSLDPRVQWIEANCTEEPVPKTLRPVQFAFYTCPVSVPAPAH